MNTNMILYIGRFILLVLLQVLVLNHVNLFGFLNPYCYILFVFWFPYTEDKIPFIFSCFLLGLSVDLFSDSGAAHAAATVLIGYARPLYMRLSFGNTFEQVQDIGKTSLGQRLVYLLLTIVTHHTVLFLLESFSFNDFVKLLLKILYSSVFTLVVCWVVISLFNKKK